MAIMAGIAGAVLTYPVSRWLGRVDPARPSRQDDIILRDELRTEITRYRMELAEVRREQAHFIEDIRDWRERYFTLQEEDQHRIVLLEAQYSSLKAEIRQQWDAHIVDLYQAIEAEPHRGQSILARRRTERPRLQDAPPVIAPHRSLCAAPAAQASLVTILLSAPWVSDTAAHRSSLLAGLPDHFVANIERDDQARTDLQRMLVLCCKWGNGILAKFLANCATQLDPSSAPGGEFAIWRKRWWPSAPEE